LLHKRVELLTKLSLLIGPLYPPRPPSPGPPPRHPRWMDGPYTIHGTKWHEVDVPAKLPWTTKPQPLTEEQEQRLERHMKEFREYMNTVTDNFAKNMGFKDEPKPKPTPETIAEE